MSYRTRIIVRYDETCFSTKPLPTCGSDYYATSTEDDREPFYCTDDQSLIERYKKLVERGVNPDFSKKTNVQRIVVSIPLKCALDESA
jgi:hypothetical protein